MIYLSQSILAWNSCTFKAVLKQEICALDPDILPLQQGLQHSSYAIGKNLSATILNVKDRKDQLWVKAGLFYSGIIAGCSCADDPTPVDTCNEYCEVLFLINKLSAEATVELIS